MGAEMSGRGEWWDVKRLNDSGNLFVIGKEGHRPRWAVGMDLDDAVAKMAIAGEADAVAAVLECPEDIMFQYAVEIYK